MDGTLDYQFSYSLEANFTTSDWLSYPGNITPENGNSTWNSSMDLEVKVLMSLLYAGISIVGILGNIAVCVVVVQNRIMRTATNYYLCSMALSDLLLLVTGMPHEIFVLWIGRPYIFGFSFCVIRGLAAEMSTNASILTIVAFTIERYIGICHPLKSHMLSRLSRVKKFIAIIWIMAGIFALPQSMQYGITPYGECNILTPLPYTFEISTFLFFLVPMTLITVLYVKIILELRTTSQIGRYGSTAGEGSTTVDRSGSVINMLVAVVCAFFICFAPFHAQRLVAFYGDATNEIQRNIYTFLTNVSGITFYLSTCINPVLYHILSRRFRQAFQDTLKRCCAPCKCIKGPKHPSAESARFGLVYQRSVTQNVSTIYHPPLTATTRDQNPSTHPTRRDLKVCFNNKPKLHHNGIDELGPGHSAAPLIHGQPQSVAKSDGQKSNLDQRPEHTLHHTWV